MESKRNPHNYSGKKQLQSRLKVKNLQLLPKYCPHCRFLGRSAVNRRSESEKLLHMENTLHQQQSVKNDAVRQFPSNSPRQVGEEPQPTNCWHIAIWAWCGQNRKSWQALAAYFGSETWSAGYVGPAERHTVSKINRFTLLQDMDLWRRSINRSVRRRPYTVVLSLNWKKAHPDIFNMLLQILEDSRLTDAKGHRLQKNHCWFWLPILALGDWKKVAVVCLEFLSRLGWIIIQRIKSLLNKFKRYFRPEFLNRLDKIIVFRQLTKDEVKGNLCLFYSKEVFGRNERVLEVTEGTVQRSLSRRGYNPSGYERNLAIDDYALLEDSLAKSCFVRSY